MRGCLVQCLCNTRTSDFSKPIGSLLVVCFCLLLLLVLAAAKNHNNFAAARLTSST